jgi:predicted nucleic acid-binding protein
LHAPALIDLEVLSVLRRSRAGGDLDDRRAELALQDLLDLPMTRYTHSAFLRRVWELRHNATPYDAAYIALAESLDCPFITADRSLAKIPGASCEVEVLRR